MSKIFLLGFVISCGAFYSFSQWELKSEFRPRLEYRNGFSQPQLLGAEPLTFVSQRTRIQSDCRNSRFRLYTSLQNVRVWGDVPQLNRADVNEYNGTNISIIRYADVLLMYAEALNENGKTNEAITYVNQVRQRGGAVALLEMTKSELRNQIRHHERPVELSMEFGIRWFDLYRWQKGNTATESIKSTLETHGKTFTQNFQDEHLIFPIPLQELNINQNLNQNPGW